MAIIKYARESKTLREMIEYVMNPGKTEESMFVTGVNCMPESAYEEMLFTKRHFHKTGGRQYMHFVQSFPPGESNPAEINEIAERLVEKMFPGYEVLIGTHTDQDHLHNHILVNSVSQEDGRKIQMSKADLQRMKDESDKLLTEYGLSICQKGVRNVEFVAYDRNKYFAMKKAISGKAFRSYVYDIAMAVDAERKQATSREDFINRLKARAIETEWSDNKKYITFKDSEGHSVRNENIESTFNINLQKDALLERFERLRNATDVVQKALRVNELAQENVRLIAEIPSDQHQLEIEGRIRLFENKIRLTKRLLVEIDDTKQQIERKEQEYSNAKLFKKKGIKDEIKRLRTRLVTMEKEYEKDNLTELEKNYEEYNAAHEKIRQMKYDIAENQREIARIYSQYADNAKFLEEVNYDEFGEAVVRAEPEKIIKAKEDVIEFVEELRTTDENATRVYYDDNEKYKETDSKSEQDKEVNVFNLSLDDMLKELKEETQAEVQTEQREYDYEHDYEER